MSTFYVVATPIGNLEDITLRALRILKEVDFILAEDTRVSQKLLSHYEIKKKIISYHQHSLERKINFILEELEEGKNIAMVSDAGTPTISDPGGRLILLISQKLPQVKIVPIPGPSALLAAASISGFPMDKFLFLGFPPKKKRRKQFFQRVSLSEYPVIFYESPFRIIKSLEELEAVDSHFQLVLCRELTKKFETVYRGTLSQVVERLKRIAKIRGEFVIVLWKEKE